MIVFPSHTINYAVPDNFNELDIELFYDCNFRNSIEQIEVNDLKNIVMCNNLVFNNTRMFYEYTKHRQPPRKLYFKSLLKKWIVPQDKIEEAYLGIQEWNLNYFHWMTEVLPALVVINQIKDKKVPVLLSENCKNCKHIIDSLKIFDIPIYYYNIRNTIKVSNLYAVKIPIIGAYNESFLSNMRLLFLKNLNIELKNKASRKIYISRKKAKRRKISNEDALLELLYTYGFESVFLEDYEIQDQIKLLNDAKIVVSCHGAGLTNILFMQPDSKVIELKANNNDYWCFFTLARLANLHYSYLLCESNRKNHRDADIVVDLIALKKAIENYI
jgi:capsular polysaccharide biosynthesis protein